MRDTAMEKTKQKQFKNRLEKGEFFKGLDPLTDAQRSFVAEWYPWAVKYARTEIDRRKKKNDRLPPRVVYDTAINTLIYTATKWKPDGGCTYKSYYHRGFYSNVANAAKKFYTSKSRTVSDNCMSRDCDYRDEESCPKIHDSYKSDIELENDIVSNIYVESLLSHLTPLQADVTRRCYINGEKQTEVARDMGVSKQAVNQALSYASRTLRAIINGDTNIPRRGRPKKVET